MQYRSTFGSMLVGAAILSQITAHSQVFQWQQRADMPQPRWGASTFVVNGRAYVVAGRSNGIDYTEMWSYDPWTDTWSSKAPIPGARRLATAFAANGKGYVGCGAVGSSTNRDDLWEYDPIADTWTQRADFPAGPRYNTWQFALNGIAYVGGGNSVGASGPFHDDAYTYDPATDTWAAGYPIPDQGRHGAVGFVVGSTGYVVAGRENSLAFVQDLWAFDAITHTWTAKTPFPGAPRSSPLSFQFQHDAVVGCGRDATDNHYDAWRYDPNSNTWAAISDYPGATAMAGTSFSIGGRAFGGLGWDLATDLSHSDLWELLNPKSNAISEIGSGTPIMAFPNPVEDGSFTMTSDLPGRVDAELIAADGRVCASWSFVGTTRVATHHLAPGAYAVQWVHDEASGIVRVVIP